MVHRKETLAAVLTLLASIVVAVPTPTETTPWGPRTTPDPLKGELSYLVDLEKRQTGSSSAANIALPTPNDQGCLPAGTTALQMNAVFKQGGANAKVVLCPNTSYDLNNTIIFTAVSQELSTLGYPTGASRAMFTVVNPSMSVAVYAPCDSCSNIQIRSVQINGNRPALGPLSGGAALIEMGGNPSGQVVRDSHLYEPRGWSALHIIEGYGNSCRNATIINNQVGPSGNSPNSAQQFRRRDDTVKPGLWADGISLACGASLVQGNVITDATDGGIVVFGAPGSQILNNTIMSVNRVMLGGINMVDFNPWGGNYTGTVVDGNVLMTAGSLIKIGIPMGPNNWAGVNSTAYRTFGGRVTNNRFVSTNGGYFGFAVTVSGHNNSYAAGNDVSQANFGAVPSAWCIKNAMPPSSQAPGIFYDPYTSTGDWSGQTNAQKTTVAFLICVMQSVYGSPSSLASSASSATTSVPPGMATTTTSQLNARATVLKGGKGPPAKTTSVKGGGKLTKAGGKAKRNLIGAPPSTMERARIPLGMPTEGPSPWSRQEVFDALLEDSFVS